jgi:DNA-directed RNA polymerase subunit M/transcription elongation factor TFIIS
MPDLKLTCDNCGSSFALSYEDDEVSYSPTHCPFCGDIYDTENEELDFNDDNNDYLDDQEDSLNDEEDDYSNSRH